MKSQILIFLTLFSILQLTAALNWCPCREQGKDVCNCEPNRGRETGPRPYPAQKPAVFALPQIKLCTETVTPPNYQPVGDVCSDCRRGAITPAPRPTAPCPCLPKLPSLEDIFKKKCSCTTPAPETTTNCGELVPAPTKPCKHHHHAKKPSCKCQRSPSAPSVSKSSISETNLNFGSLKTPKIVPQQDGGDRKPKPSNVKEELLYDQRGNVLSQGKENCDSDDSSDSSEYVVVEVDGMFGGNR